MSTHNYVELFHKGEPREDVKNCVQFKARRPERENLHSAHAICQANWAYFLNITYNQHYKK